MKLAINQEVKLADVGQHSIPTIWDAARECTKSRLMGGHSYLLRQLDWLDEGTKVGRNSNALSWK